MYISVKPHRATVHHDSAGEYLLVFGCTPRNDSAVLEINRDYVFASKNKLRLFSKRRNCELLLRIRRRSSISDTGAANMNLSRDKIGELTFYPSTKADAMTVATKASLEASIFIDDQLFNNLMNVLLVGRRPESLQLGIEENDLLQYGWEPDGSRMEWKTQDPYRSSNVDIVEMLMAYELFAGQ